MGIIRKPINRDNLGEANDLVEDLIAVSRLLEKYSDIYQIRIAMELIDEYVESL